MTVFSLSRPMTMATLWLKMIEAAPLPAFLLCVSWFDSYESGNWAAPYYCSVAVSALTSVYLLVRGIVLNRIFVGINLYLLSGAIGQLWQLQSLNQFYGEVRAAGMLIWVCAVGAVSTAFTNVGFIGVAATSRGVVVRYSLLLLAVAAVACGISLYFVGNRWLSELLPFVFLFTAQGRLHGLLHQQQVVAV